MEVAQHHTVDLPLLFLVSVRRASLVPAPFPFYTRATFLRLQIGQEIFFCRTGLEAIHLVGI